MVKKSFLYTLCFLLLFLIEAVFRPITVFGVSPLYVLCGTVAVGILENEKFGGIFGLIFGLFCDFAGGSVFGSQAICFMFVGFLAGAISDAVLSKGLARTVIFTEGAIIFFYLLKALFAIILDESDFIQILLYILLPKVLLTLPFSILIYYFIRLIRHFSDRNRERKRLW